MRIYKEKNRGWQNWQWKEEI